MQFKEAYIEREYNRMEEDFLFGIQHYHHC